jgi:hypothetical protein
MRKGFEFEYGRPQAAQARRSWPVELLFPAVLVGVAYLLGRTFFGF